MVSGGETKKKHGIEDDLKKEIEKSLILHNDEKNTFEFVIDTLMDICGHDAIQAEQCAFITHFKGKCEIKSGQFDYLKTMKDQLILKGLSATIE